MAAKVFKLKANDNASSEAVIQSTIVFNMLKKSIGPSCISLSGYDYHDGTSSTGDAKDLQAGQLVGQVIQLAHIMKQKIFLQIVSDGGVVSGEGNRKWMADAGDKSMTILCMYDPSKAVEQSKIQVGHYTKGQSAFRDNFFAKSTTAIAQISMLNYLKFAGQFQDLRLLYSENEWPVASIDQVLTIG
jgi:hypothetical protein